MIEINSINNMSAFVWSFFVFAVVLVVFFFFLSKIEIFFITITWVCTTRNKHLKWPEQKIVFTGCIYPASWIPRTPPNRSTELFRNTIA